MRDLKDLKKEEEGANPKKVPTLALVGILGLVVFFALVLFFRRGDQEPPQPTVAAITPNPPAPMDPPLSPPSEGEISTALPEPGLKPGEIHFSEKKEEVVAPPSPPAVPNPAEKKGTAVTKKDDLTFFKTLKDKKERNVILKPKKEFAPKKEMVKAQPKNSFQASKPPVKPVSISRSGLSKRYAVQVASFSEKDGADQLAQKLKKKGLDSYVVAGDVPQKGKWYRVRVGSYPNRDEAKRAGDQIHESERLNFFVTSD